MNIREANLPSTPASEEKSSERVTLHYLDGLRGLAALYVVAYHAYLEVLLTPDGQGLPYRLRLFTRWLGFGHLAVAVFIVLSGYCLMLPLTGDKNLSFDVGRFICRTAAREYHAFHDDAVMIELAMQDMMYRIRKATEQAANELSLAPLDTVEHEDTSQDTADDTQNIENCENELIRPKTLDILLGSSVAHLPRTKNAAFFLPLQSQPGRASERAQQERPPCFSE